MRHVVNSTEQLSQRSGIRACIHKVEQRAEHKYGGVFFNKKHIDTGECGVQQCWNELKEIKLLSGAVDFLIPASARVFPCVGDLQ